MAKSRFRAATAVILAAVMFAVGCLVTSEGDEVIFGRRDSTCESVRLSNDEGDQAKATGVTDCLLAEISAGRPVTVDIAAVTAEGDPIFMRYAFDGETTLIVRDDRADAFGSGGIEAKRCDTIGRTAWFPEGIDCETVRHAGFADAVG